MTGSTERGEFVEQEGKPTNMLEQPLSTIWAMGEIEGDAWLEKQMEEVDQVIKKFYDNAFHAISSWSEEELKSGEEREYGVLRHLKLLERMRRRYEEGDAVRNVGTIYGDGGNRRWYLYSDGEVKLSGSHTGDGMLFDDVWGGHVKAEQLGFKIHNPQAFEEAKDLQRRISKM